MASNENVFSYVLVGNIPSKLRSIDLRSFFSQFIEAGKFQCFHFRHRPEVLKRNQNGENQNDISLAEEISSSTLKGKTGCCVVRLKEEHVKELLKVYHGENWVDKNGKLSAIKAVVSEITFKNNDETQIGNYQTRKEKRDHKRECVEFVKEDLLKLSELHPPLFMPNGNVGTSLNIFMNLIRTCQLPPQVIKKLGLSFPSGRSKHRYGNVAFNYKTKSKGNVSLYATELINTANSDKRKENVRDNSKSNEDYKDHEGDMSDKVQSEDSESEGEEDWERHEALYDDVDCQGRTKERLFENKIELKWEKGGSGLVFYTDAAYWDRLNGDFDEQTADDWDVDMAVYEKEGSTGDRHSKQLLEMRIEEQRLTGNNVDDDDAFPRKVGEFERHTKGFGGTLMKKQGWSEGDSLGTSQPGIKEPIPSDGQHPRCKKGFGYYGEKLERHVKRRCADKDVVISTVYDTSVEKTSTPYQSAGPFTLKYRTTVDFVPQKENKL